jgi:uncharacterized protein YceH (UPF0502 family)
MDASDVQARIERLEAEVAALREAVARLSS